MACAAGIVLTLGVSWASELVQAVLPERVYDLRDVMLDGISGTLGVMLGMLGERGRAPVVHRSAAPAQGGGQ